MTDPRFEVVRTNAGWHSRYKAANGRILFTTEVYTGRSAAEHAVTSLVAGIQGVDDMGEDRNEDGSTFYTIDGGTASPNVYEVDERHPTTPEEVGQEVLRTPIDTPEAEPAALVTDEHGQRTWTLDL